MLDGKKPEIRIGGDFDPVPMDKYTAQIVDVNLVSQFNKFKGLEVDMLNYQFAILDDKSMGEGSEDTTRGRYLWKRCSLSISEKSWLGKLLKGVEGRDLTKDEMEAFDPESLVGKQVDVMVEAKEGSNGVVYNNIVAFSKTIKKLDMIEFEPKPSQVVKTSKPISSQDPEEVIKELKEEK